MYSKVLLPLDGTRESERILPLIEKELSPGAEVLLLLVVKPVKTQVISGLTFLGSEREEAASLEAMAYLRMLGSNHIGDSRPWRCSTVFSESSSQGIVNFARREGVDLIALIEKKSAGLGRLLRGNTARRVRQKSPVEVRTFPP